MNGVLLRRAEIMPTAVRLWVSYVVLALLKRCVPLATLARWAWVDGNPPRDPVSEQRVARVILGLRRRLRANDDCLQTSLLLYRELSRLGAEPTLAVGFRRAGDRLEGHAWVSVGGQPIDDRNGADGFIPAFSFGRYGAIVESAPANSQS